MQFQFRINSGAGRLFAALSSLDRSPLNFCSRLFTCRRGINAIFHLQQIMDARSCRSRNDLIWISSLHANNEKKVLEFGGNNELIVYCAAVIKARINAFVMSWERSKTWLARDSGKYSNFKHDLLLCENFAIKKLRNWRLRFHRSITSRMFEF